jgi:mono/diheme cytochrome c family protein
MDRKRIPWWAAAVLGLLPIWAIVYAGTLSEADTGAPSQLELGGQLFAEKCAGCHGATGGGAVGPALAGGAVLETFPERADHLRWVWGGSNGWPDSTYGAQNKPKQSGMPAFGETLTPAELLAVVRYERETLSGEELNPDTEVLGPDEELQIVTPDGNVDAIDYYFGEGASADGATFKVVDSEPFINGAKFSAPAE